MVFPPPEVAGATLRTGYNVATPVPVEVGDDDLIRPAPVVLQNLSLPKRARVTRVPEPNKPPGEGCRNRIEQPVPVNIGRDDFKRKGKRSYDMLRPPGAVAGMADIFVPHHLMLARVRSGFPIHSAHSECHDDVYIAVEVDVRRFAMHRLGRLVVHHMPPPAMTGAVRLLVPHD